MRFKYALGLIAIIFASACVQQLQTVPGFQSIAQTFKPETVEAPSDLIGTQNINLIPPSPVSADSDFSISYEVKNFDSAKEVTNVDICVYDTGLCKTDSSVRICSANVSLIKKKEDVEKKEDVVSSPSGSTLVDNINKCKNIDENSGAPISPYPSSDDDAVLKCDARCTNKPTCTVKVVVPATVGEKTVSSTPTIYYSCYCGSAAAAAKQEIAGCNFADFTGCSSARTLANGESISNMCGFQYYKYTAPSGNECSVTFTATPSQGSVELYVIKDNCAQTYSSDAVKSAGSGARSVNTLGVKGTIYAHVRPATGQKLDSYSIKLDAVCTPSSGVAPTAPTTTVTVNAICGDRGSVQCSGNKLYLCNNNFKWELSSDCEAKGWKCYPADVTHLKAYCAE